jgi:hypothetical protein
MYAHYRDDGHSTVPVHPDVENPIEQARDGVSL